MRKKTVILCLVFLSVVVVGFSIGAQAEQNLVPAWIKNTAKFWTDGKISDQEFITALQWLIDNHVLVVSKGQQSTDSLPKGYIEEFLPLPGVDIETEWGYVMLTNSLDSLPYRADQLGLSYEETNGFDHGVTKRYSATSGVNAPTQMIDLYKFESSKLADIVYTALVDYKRKIYSEQRVSDKLINNCYAYSYYQQYTGGQLALICHKNNVVFISSHPTPSGYDIDDYNEIFAKVILNKISS